nr:uncharacterized protein LOC127304192 [Lolium perenne]
MGFCSDGPGLGLKVRPDAWRCDAVNHEWSAASGRAAAAESSARGAPSSSTLCVVRRAATRDLDFVSAIIADLCSCACSYLCISIVLPVYKDSAGRPISWRSGWSARLIDSYWYVYLANHLLVLVPYDLDLAQLCSTTSSAPGFDSRKDLHPPRVPLNQIPATLPLVTKELGTGRLLGTGTEHEGLYYLDEGSDEAVLASSLSPSQVIVASSQAWTPLFCCYVSHLSDAF